MFVEVKRNLLVSMYLQTMLKNRLYQSFLLSTKICFLSLSAQVDYILLIHFPVYLELAVVSIQLRERGNNAC